MALLEVLKSRRWDPVGRSKELKACPWGIYLAWPLPVFSFDHHKVNSSPLPHVFAAMIFSPHMHGAKQPWTEHPETMSHSKSFLI
jgi:hypothetical protein